ncbi:MAG: hypothetical protein ACOYJB_07845, partial [Christensenellaceae bacterium]
TERQPLFRYAPLRLPLRDRFRTNIVIGTKNGGSSPTSGSILVKARDDGMVEVFEARIYSVAVFDENGILIELIEDETYYMQNVPIGSNKLDESITYYAHPTFINLYFSIIKAEEGNETIVFEIPIVLGLYSIMVIACIIEIIFLLVILIIEYRKTKKQK